jgi:hypothetical protein
MLRPTNKGYQKRTQKDYTLSFKLQVIQEIEQGILTRTQALNKYGFKLVLLYVLG